MLQVDFKRQYVILWVQLIEHFGDAVHGLEAGNSIYSIHKQ